MGRVDMPPQIVLPAPPARTLNCCSDPPPQLLLGGEPLRSCDTPPRTVTTPPGWGQRSLVSPPSPTPPPSNFSLCSSNRTPWPQGEAAPPQSQFPGGFPQNLGGVSRQDPPSPGAPAASGAVTWVGGVVTSWGGCLSLGGALSFGGVTNLGDLRNFGGGEEFEGGPLRVLPPSAHPPALPRRDRRGNPVTSKM